MRAHHPHIVHRPILNRPILNISDNENVPTNVSTTSKNVTYQGENVTYKSENVTSITKNVTSNVTSYEDLNKNEMKILAILMENEQLNREEIADRMSKTVRTVQRALNSLRDKGYIQRIGAKRYLYMGGC